MAVRTDAVAAIGLFWRRFAQEDRELDELHVS